MSIFACDLTHLPLFAPQARKAAAALLKKAGTSTKPIVSKFGELRRESSRSEAAESSTLSFSSTASWLEPEELGLEMNAVRSAKTTRESSSSLGLSMPPLATLKESSLKEVEHGGIVWAASPRLTA